MDTQFDIAAAGRGRWAIAAMFLSNGFLAGSWVPQIPVLVMRLGISETTLGLLILVFGLGALVAMPACGYLMAVHSPRAMIRLFGGLASISLLLVGLAGNMPAILAAVFFFGGTMGAMDVAMNTNAVSVEKRLGKAVMSSSHGFWSLGGFLGGAVGGFAVERLGYLAHAGLVTALTVLIVGIAMLHLVADIAPETGPKRSSGMPRNPIIYLIGGMALFSMIPEGAVLDWAALHLRQAFGADIAVASLAFAAFSGTMAVMRFLGDGIRNRFGAVRTLRVSALIAAAGMFVAGLATVAWMAIAAFGLAGLGVANMVPIAFSAAGNQDGIASSTGMSVVTTMGYSGILVAPSAIGFIAERTGFAPVFLTLSAMLVLVSSIAGLARAADFRAAPPSA